MFLPSLESSNAIYRYRTNDIASLKPSWMEWCSWHKRDYKHSPFNELHPSLSTLRQQLSSINFRHFKKKLELTPPQILILISELTFKRPMDWFLRIRGCRAKLKQCGNNLIIYNIVSMIVGFYPIISQIPYEYFTDISGWYSKIAAYLLRAWRNSQPIHFQGTQISGA